MVIPKKIHIAWKSRDLLESDSFFIQNCIGKLLELSDDWDAIIYDDNDIDEYLRENLDRKDYLLLENKHIVEKCDVWRLIKMYQEGGLYTDIDRLCNTPLSSIIKETTKTVIPTCGDLDFSHDFMLSAPQNPIFSETLKLNLERRYSGINNIYYLGTQTYAHGIMKSVTGEILPQTKENIIMFREMFETSGFIQTYRESPPYNTFVYREENGQIAIDHEAEKRKFYAECKLKHWTGDW